MRSFSDAVSADATADFLTLSLSKGPTVVMQALVSQSIRIALGCERGRDMQQARGHAE